MTAPNSDCLAFDHSMIQKSNGDFLPPSVCSTNIGNWLKKLQSAFGKKQASRAIPYIQKGIDTIYSELEAMRYRLYQKSSKSYGYGVADITDEPLWIILVGQVSRNFSSIVKIVHPSKTPNEAIRSKHINRTFSSFFEQKRTLLQHLQGGIAKSGELGRLQAQILDGQVESLKKAYDTHEHLDENIWLILNDCHKKQQLLQMSRGAGKTSTAEAKGSIKDGSAVMDVSGELFSEAKIKFEKTWDFGAMRNELEATMSVGAKLSYQDKAHINLGTGGGATYKKGTPGKAEIGNVSMAGVNTSLPKQTNFSDAELENRNGFVPIQLIPGVDIGIDAFLAIEAGLKVTVTHQLTIGQIMSMKNEAELFVGAEVKGQIKGGINTSNIMGADEVFVGSISGGAFIGAKAKGSSTVTFMARGINAVSAQVSGAVSAGAGINGTVESIVRRSGDIKFRMAAGATAGIGADVDFNTTVNPMLFKVILWDHLAHYFTTQAYQDRTNAKMDFKVNCIVLTRCDDKLVSYLNQIRCDYNTLAEMLWRLPADAHTSVVAGVSVLHDPIVKPSDASIQQHLTSVGVADDEYLYDEDEMTNAELGIVHGAQTLQSQNKTEKQAKKAQSKGKRLKRKLKGLLVLPPQPESKQAA
ncbi:hypothetical protein QWZ04_16680 [Vibrio tapetis subsp. quintayensis]|uniref:hypothetical protein n=1 Tax=Vibrio tapetis TaxID=52443 RepID=UPI0025B392FF|nr:hypothetical protein [Vibrio tapetis]MDN3681944.1 hypothetical protein [Vibrio tapetis subsp. quintayensis]